MGYMRAHAIVVTSFSEEDMRRVHAKALEIFEQRAPAHMGLIDRRELYRNLVTDLRETPGNGHFAFAVLPDSSDDSDWGDELRSQLIEYLKQPTYSDGSSNIHWVEVQFADDEGHTFVTAHSEEGEYDAQGRYVWRHGDAKSEYERGYQKGFEAAGGLALTASYLGSSYAPACE